MQTTSQAHVAIAPVPAASGNSSLKTADMIGIVLLAVPLLAILSIVSYRKYRARTLKHQIAVLERIWKLNSIEKTS